MARVTFVRKEPMQIAISSRWQATRSWYPGVVYSGTDGSAWPSNENAVTTKDADWEVLVYKRADASGSYRKSTLKFKPSIQHASGSYKSGTDKVNTNAAIKPGFDLWYDLWAGRVSEWVDDLALKRLKSKIADKSKSINVGVPLAEIRELRGLVAAITFSATDLVRALIDIKRTRGKSAYQFASHAWLNWSFAAAPTMGDISLLAEVIAQELNDSGNKTYTEYGAARTEWSTPQTKNHTIGLGYGLNGQCKWSLRHKYSSRVTAGFKTPMRSSLNYSALRSFGLEPAALVPSLWELTAFSWLVDYFSTVGDCLSDTFQGDGVESIYCVRTSKYQVEGDVGVVWVPYSGREKAIVQIQGPRSPYVYKSITRSVLGKIPKRTLRFKSIDEIGMGGINKLLNLASVLVGGKAASNKY